MGSCRNTKRKKEGNKLKFIAFYEYNFEDMDKILEKGAQVLAMREKDAERFPKAIFDFTIGGETKGVAVFETDNPDQLWNLALHNAPELTIKFAPILEATRGAKLYQKIKK